MCSKTLEANIYNPIQCKMKNLIQTISTLSLTTGKYIYGNLYKKKEKESYVCCIKSYYYKREIKYKYNLF